jgi:hypothetical protein
VGLNGQTGETDVTKGKRVKNSKFEVNADDARKRGITIPNNLKGGNYVLPAAYARASLGYALERRLSYD